MWRLFVSYILNKDKKAGAIGTQPTPRSCEDLDLVLCPLVLALRLADLVLALVPLLRPGGQPGHAGQPPRPGQPAPPRPHEARRAGSS